MSIAIYACVYYNLALKLKGILNIQLFSVMFYVPWALPYFIIIFIVNIDLILTSSRSKSALTTFDNWISDLSWIIILLEKLNQAPGI